MSYKAISQKNVKAVQKRRSTHQVTQNHRPSIHLTHPAAIIQRAQLNPGSLTRQDVQHLQSTIGNRAVGRLLTQAPRNAGPVGSRSVAQRQLAENVFGLPVQRQEGSEEEEGLQMKTNPGLFQRKEMEEELVQGKFESVQRQGVEDEELVQGKFATRETPTQRQGVKDGVNRTGMPDSLKGGLEQLSGFDLSGVRVHRNSGKPAQLNALAYAQGQDIHLGPGQEKHLPHEGWHAVQQMQGRVKPTLQAKGVAINDDAGLEKEADVMGSKALFLDGDQAELTQLKQAISPRKTTQRILRNAGKNILVSTSDKNTIIDVNNAAITVAATKDDETGGHAEIYLELFENGTPVEYSLDMFGANEGRVVVRMKRFGMGEINSRGKGGFKTYAITTAQADQALVAATKLKIDAQSETLKYTYYLPKCGIIIF